MKIEDFSTEELKKELNKRSEQMMKINRKQLLSLYLNEINKISDQNDDKEQFYPEEIIEIVCRLLEENEFTLIKK